MLHGYEFIVGSLAGTVVWALAVWLAIRRLQKKLGPDASPTTWTYINELGGYLVFGIIIMAILIVTTVVKLMG